eukprot:GHVL01041013.1.p1 GENE.GHVL01041013.1~~GHVL01041013.1.p1  ORF type:complete len:734 (-),score=131.13 GHVL01041013.1:737-2938(-)
MWDRSSHVEIKNDYCQHFVDTAERPQNFIRDSEPKTRFAEFPKLQRLVDLKSEIVTKRATPYMCLKADLRTFDLSSLGTKFDVIIIDPPWVEYSHRTTAFHSNNEEETEPWCVEDIMALRIQDIAEKPSFIFLWCSEVHLEDARTVLEHWGFRRCEDICWIKTNQSWNVSQGKARIYGDETSLVQRTKEHCLMGISGHVRRSSDTHLIHANVDTDIIIDEEPSDPASTAKPQELYAIIERFCLSRRRLELFGTDRNLRNGWLTIGRSLTGSTFDKNTYLSWFEGDGKYPLVLDYQGGRYLGTTDEIEQLRPKTPPKERPGTTEGTGGEVNEEVKPSEAPPLLQQPPQRRNGGGRAAQRGGKEAEGHNKRRRKGEEDDAADHIARKVPPLPAGIAPYSLDMDITGKVMTLAVEAPGAQVIIQKIENQPSLAVTVLEEVLQNLNLVTLACDNSGCYVIKQIARLIQNDDLKFRLVNILCNEMTTLLSSHSGTMTLQELAPLLHNPQMAQALVAAVVGASVESISTNNGCCLLRRVAECSTTKQFIFSSGLINLIMGKLTRISRTSAGSRALEKVFLAAPQDIADKMALELLLDTTIINDPYANFLLQTMITESTEGRCKLFQTLSRQPGRIATVSCGAYSSRVVERLVEVADPEQLGDFVSEFLSQRHTLRSTAMDQYGNFVMKNLINATRQNNAIHSALMEGLQPFLSELSSSEYGRHVVDAIDRTKGANRWTN